MEVKVYRGTSPEVRVKKGGIVKLKQAVKAAEGALDEQGRLPLPTTPRQCAYNPPGSRVEACGRRGMGIA